MTESTYAAMRAYIDVAVELQVGKRMEAMRAALPVTTRDAAPVVLPPPVPGKDGEDGKDGRGVTSVQLRDGNLIVRFSDGTEQDVGHVVGKNGKDGDPGKDGIGKDGKDGVGKDGKDGKDGVATRAEIESIVEQRVADINVRTFADTYQGVFEPDKLYTRGLLATWGGSLWLSLADTRSKPGESGDWRLVVKKGSDGRK